MRFSFSVVGKGVYHESKVTVDRGLTAVVAYAYHGKLIN
jgi:hypothetical protein